jgi:hypothetical protein
LSISSKNAFSQGSFLLRKFKVGTATRLLEKVIMTKTPTVTKRNSVAKAVGIRKGDANRAAIKRTKMRSKSITREQGTGETKADKIKRDLKKRRRQNQKSLDCQRAFEHLVIDLNVDWTEFHELLNQAFEDGRCNYDYTECRRILTGMGLDAEAIEACLSYLSLQGGGSDCEVVLNVDVIDPLVDFSCTDCGHDYDEYYMVRNDIWKACGVGTGTLCIGCLEKRIGRQLNQQDFADAPINDLEWGIKSLRLRDRLTTPARASDAGSLPQAVANRQGYRQRAEAKNCRRRKNG